MDEAEMGPVAPPPRPTTVPLALQQSMPLAEVLDVIAQPPGRWAAVDIVLRLHCYRIESASAHGLEPWARALGCRPQGRGRLRARRALAALGSTLKPRHARVRHYNGRTGDIDTHACKRANAAPSRSPRQRPALRARQAGAAPGAAAAAPHAAGQAPRPAGRGGVWRPAGGQPAAGHLRKRAARAGVGAEGVGEVWQLCAGA
jgi:hypothetical protein